MHAFNTLSVALVSTLASFGLTSPVNVSPAPRALLANQAIVNMYSGSSCGGSSESFSVTNSYACRAVTSPKASIEVSENNCATYTWSGSNCGGSSMHITGDSCFSVLYAAVSVQC
ncbi:hypothetical protein F4818DRAFT_373974 [Hypoxylon cercidicola]|nr:hypothetical protein F4818DRAFT_373974 [Hypoxylon cercidicola]